MSFVCYRVDTDSIPVYYGEGAKTYGESSKGRKETHERALRRAINGKAKNEMYRWLAEKVKTGSLVEFVTVMESDMKEVTYSEEQRLIREHRVKYPKSILFNQQIEGKIVAPDRIVHGSPAGNVRGPYQTSRSTLSDDALASLRREECRRSTSRAKLGRQWSSRPHAHMTQEEEKEFLKPFIEQKAPVAEIRQALIRRFARFSLGATYAMLRRNGYYPPRKFKDAQRTERVRGTSHLAGLTEVQKVYFRSRKRLIKDRLNDAISQSSEAGIQAAVDDLALLGFDVLTPKLWFDLKTRSEVLDEPPVDACVTAPGQPAELPAPLPVASGKIAQEPRKLRISELNKKRIDVLLADPELHSLSYRQLGEKHSIGWQNVVRLLRIAEVEKKDSRTSERGARCEAFLADSELLNLPIEQLAKKHGISRSTAIRYSLGSKRGLKPVSLPVTTAKPVFHPAVHPSSPVNGVCHQRVIRDDTKAEDVARLTPIIGDLSALKASQFTLAAEPYAQCHRDFIKRYEWLGNPGISIKWCFAARFNSELGGVVLLSEPYHPSELEALIARGACAGWTPKNLGSRMVMFACRWMAENTPKRQFIAYADEEAGEVGQIYQACNFKFLGWKEASYGLRDNGKRVSLQTFKRTSRMVPWLAKQGIELPVACFTEKGFLRWSQIPLDLKKRMRQHIEAQKQLVKKVAIRRGKYVMVQGATPAETRRLNSDFTAPTFPYPKRAAMTPTAPASSPACAPT